MFVIDVPLLPNQGGLSGMDTLCQTTASASDITGVWTAFVSTSSVSAFSRLLDGRCYRQLNAGVIVNSTQQLRNESLFLPILQTQTGRLLNASEPAETEIWTGVSDGLAPPAYCGDWTSSSAALFGSIGETRFTDSRWAYVGAELSCNSPRRIICHEGRSNNTYPPPSSPTPPPPTGPSPTFAPTSSPAGATNGSSSPSAPSPPSPLPPPSSSAPPPPPPPAVNRQDESTAAASAAVPNEVLFLIAAALLLLVLITCVVICLLSRRRRRRRTRTATAGYRRTAVASNQQSAAGSSRASKAPSRRRSVQLVQHQYNNVVVQQPPGPPDYYRPEPAKTGDVVAHYVGAPKPPINAESYANAPMPPSHQYQGPPSSSGFGTPVSYYGLPPTHDSSATFYTDASGSYFPVVYGYGNPPVMDGYAHGDLNDF